MNILRGISRWLLAIAIGAMLGFWITASILQATILNRDTVKGWLAESGAYDNALRSLLPLQGQGSIATNQDMQKAFDATFPPSYVQTQTETVLDATYDWVEGKKDAITFSIPVNEKRDEFIANLAAQIQPRIEALPPCPTRANPSTTNPTCIPQGVSPQEFTSGLIRLSDNDPFLTKPITEKTFTGNSSTSTPQLTYLPTTASIARQMVFILPALIVLASAAYVLLHDDKLRGLTLVGRRVFIQGLIVVIGGVFMLVVGNNLTLPAQAGTAQAAITTSVINPLLNVVLPDVGMTLVIFGGAAAAAGLAAWMTAIIIRRKYTKVTTFQPKVTPVAPAASPANTPQPKQPGPSPKPPRIIQ